MAFFYNLIEICFLFVLLVLIEFWLLRDDGEVFQRFLVAGVDEAVGVATGAVVAVASREPFFSVVIEAASLAGGDEDHLTVGFVLVIADGAAHVEASQHNLVQSVEEDARPRVALAPLEVGHHGFLNIVKIYNHYYEFMFFYLNQN